MDEKEKYLLLKSKAGFSMSFEDWSTEYNSDDKFKTSMDGALDRLSLKKKDFFGTEETPRESRKVEEPESSDSKLGEPSSVSQEEITDGSLESSTEEPITSEKPPEEPYDFEKTFLSGYKNPFPIPEDQDVVDYTQYDENKFQKQTVKLESLNQEIDNYRKPAVRYQDFSGKQREEYSVYVDKKKKSREIKSELAKSKFFRDQAIGQEVAYENDLMPEFTKEFSALKTKEKLDGASEWNYLVRGVNKAVNIVAGEQVYMSEALKEDAKLNRFVDEYSQNAKNNLKASEFMFDTAMQTYKNDVADGEYKLQTIALLLNDEDISQADAERASNHITSSLETQRLNLLNEYDKHNAYLEINGMFIHQINNEFQSGLETGMKSYSNELVKFPRQTASLANAIFRHGTEGGAWNETLDEFYNSMAEVTGEGTLKIDEQNPMTALTGQVLGQLTEIVGLSAINPYLGMAFTGAMTHDEAFDFLKNQTNLSVTEANNLAILYASIAAPLEYLGARIGLENFAKNVLKDVAIDMMKKEGGVWTKQVLKKRILYYAERLLKAQSTEALEEGVTEGVQNIWLEKGVKEFAWNKVWNDDPNKYIKPLDPEKYWENLMQDVGGGAYGGFLFGTGGSIRVMSSSQVNQMGAMLTNDASFESMKVIAKARLNQGKMSKEEHGTFILNMNETREAFINSSGVYNKSDKKRAIELSLERSDVNKLPDTDITKSAKLKVVNEQLNEIGGNNTAVSGSMVAEIRLMGLKNKGFSRMVELSEQGQTQDVKESKDGEKTVTPTKSYQAAVNRSKKTVDNEIAKLEKEGGDKNSQRLKNLYTIKRNLTDFNGDMFLTTPSETAVKMNKRDAGRAKNITSAIDVLRKVASKGDGNLTTKDAADIRKVLSKNGIDANTIQGINNLEGMPVRDAIKIFQGSKKTLGSMSEDNRSFVNAQNISENTGVEVGIIADISNKYKELGYAVKESRNLTELATRVITALSAKTGKTKREILDSIDIVGEQEKVSSAIKGKTGATNPIVKLAELYSDVLTKAEKKAIAKSLGKKSWSKTVNKKFIDGFIKSLMIGETQVEELKKPFRELKSYLNTVIGNKKNPFGEDISQVAQNMYAKMTGDFTRSQRIDSDKTRTALQDLVKRQNEAKKKIEDSMKEDEESYGKEDGNIPTAEKIKSKFERITKQSEKVFKSLSRLIPDLKIRIHTTPESYYEATGDYHKGEYDFNSKTIHINLHAATFNTVAHEAFHAILLDHFSRAGMGEATITKVTRSLLESIRKNIEGDKTKQSELYNAETFAKSEYEKTLWGEETLAEFTGYLSANYLKLDTSLKAQVVNWINKVLGKYSPFKNKKFTDADVALFLNNIAKSFAKGKILSERESDFSKVPTGHNIDKIKFVKNSKEEIIRVKKTPIKEGNGATLNLDGTVYEGKGILLGIDSDNTVLEKLSPEGLADFMKKREDLIYSEKDKAGLYKFEGEQTTSMDLSLVAPVRLKTRVLEIAKWLRQESIWNIEAGEGYNTGKSGKNPVKMTPELSVKIHQAVYNKVPLDIFLGNPSDYSVRKSKGRVDITSRDAVKFARIGVEDKYTIQAINNIGMGGINFSERDISNRISNELNKVYSEEYYSKYILSEDGPHITALIKNDIEAERERGAGRDALERMSGSLTAGVGDATRNAYIKEHNEAQKKTLQEWIDYLIASDYPIAFKYLVFESVISNDYDLKRGKLTKRNTKSIRNFSPFDAGSLAELYAASSENLPVDYAKLQAENAAKVIEDKKAIATSSGGKWIKFDGGRSTPDAERAENAKALAKVVADTYWCTKTNAKSQLDGGDFYVFVSEAADGKYLPRIAVRMNGNNVGEVRGNRSSKQNLEPEMVPVADKFLKENIPNDSGKKWIKANEYNQKVIDFNNRMKKTTLVGEVGSNQINRQTLITKDNLDEYGEILAIEGEYTLDYSGKNGNVEDLEETFRDKINNGFISDELEGKVFSGSSYSITPETKYFFGDFFGQDSKNIKVVYGDFDLNNNFNKSQFGFGKVEFIAGNVMINEIREDNLFKNLKKIGGKLTLRGVWTNDLGALEYIGGNFNIRASVIKYVGNTKRNILGKKEKPLYIGGMIAINSGSDIGTFGNIPSVQDFVMHDKSSLIASLGGIKRIENRFVASHDDILNDINIGSFGDLEYIGGTFDNGGFFKSFENIKYIGGNLVLGKSEEYGFLINPGSMGKLEHIGGSVRIKNTAALRTLGGLKRIDGNLIIQEGSEFNSLGELKTVNGDFSLGTSNVVSLGLLEYVGGSITTSNYDLESTGNLKEVGESAYFSNAGIKTLGKLKKVGSTLTLKNSSVESLGELQSIGNDLYITDTPLKSLSNLRNIGGDLYVPSTLESFGALKNIGGSLSFQRHLEMYVADKKSIVPRKLLTSLGNITHVEGDVSLTSSNIYDLGSLKYIGQNLWMGGADVATIKGKGNLRYTGGQIYGGRGIDKFEAEVKDRMEVDGFETRRSKAPRKRDIFFNKPASRAAILNDATIKRNNDIQALEISNIDIARLTPYFDNIAADVVNVLESYNETGDPSFLMNKKKRSAKEVASRNVGLDMAIGSMDAYLAMDRMLKADVGEMQRHPTWTLPKEIGTGLQRWYLGMFGDTLAILRNELAHYSTEDFLQVISSLGMFEYFMGASQSATDIELANTARIKINDLLKSYKLLNDKESTQEFMARTSFIAMLMAPTTETHKDLAKWTLSVIKSINVHKTNLKKRHDKEGSSDETQANASIKGAGQVQADFITMLDKYGDDIGLFWDDVVGELEQLYPTEVRLIKMTSDMHRIHSHVILNYKKKIGDKDTYEGLYHNARRMEGIKDSTTDVQAENDFFDQMVSTGAAIEDRNKSVIGRDMYLNTWSFVDIQQRAYNISSKMAYTGSAVRQIDKATKSNAFDLAVEDKKGREAIRTKLRSMVNFSVAADGLTLGKSGAGWAKRAWSYFNRFKNEVLISLKQPLVQLSVLAYTMINAPKEYISILNDMRDANNLEPMQRLFMYSSSLGSRSASYMISSATSTNIDAAGIMLGLPTKWLSRNLLNNPDYLAATTSWLAFYKQKRQEQLGDKEFSWKEESTNPNLKAAHYAELKQQSSQASNVKEAGSKFSTGSDETWSMIRESFFPFKYFDNSYRTNVLVDLKMSRHDNDARKRMIGYSTIPIAYAGVKWYTRYAIFNSVLATLQGMFPPEEDDEEKKNTSTARQLAYIGMSAMEEAISKMETDNGSLANEVAVQELGDFFMPWMPFDELRRPILNRSVNWLDYQFGTANLEQINEKGEKESVEMPNKTLYESVDDMINHEAQILNVYTGDKTFDYLAPSLIMIYNGIKLANIANSGKMEGLDGKIYYPTPKELKLIKLFSVLNITMGVVPMQDFKKLQKKNDRVLEELMKNERWSNLSKQGELNTETQIQLYNEWEKTSIVKGDPRTYGKKMGDLLLDNYINNDYPIDNKKLDELMEELKGFRKKEGDVRNKLSILNYNEIRRYSDVEDMLKLIQEELAKADKIRSNQKDQED